MRRQRPRGKLATGPAIHHRCRALTDVQAAERRWRIAQRDGEVEETSVAVIGCRSILMIMVIGIMLSGSGRLLGSMIVVRMDVIMQTAASVIVIVPVKGNMRHRQQNGADDVRRQDPRPETSPNSHLSFLRSRR